MNALRFSIIALTVATACASAYNPANAGVWDDPENLKALPEDISPEELRSTMMGFTGATGSRCSSCHVGEVETDLRTYDFSLDDKEKKLKAREMILMVRNINEYLTENLGEYSADPMTVECATCHRGRAKPEMIQDLLLTLYRNEGMERALTEYRTLRDKYYGDYAFDFSHKALNQLAQILAIESDFDAALKFVDLNLEFNPQSVRAYQLQGDIWKDKGNVAAARNSYEKGLEIQPDNAFMQRLIERLDAAP